MSLEYLGIYGYTNKNSKFVLVRLRNLGVFGAYGTMLLYTWYVLTNARLGGDLSQHWPGRFPIFLPSAVAQYVC